MDWLIQVEHRGQGPEPGPIKLRALPPSPLSWPQTLEGRLWPQQQCGFTLISVLHNLLFPCCLGRSWRRLDRGCTVKIYLCFRV
jgi:hypothetical protein